MTNEESLRVLCSMRYANYNGKKFLNSISLGYDLVAIDLATQ